MSKPARVTISDVAKAAKTGKTSISRYLNGEKHLLSDALLAKKKWSARGKFDQYK